MPGPSNRPLRAAILALFVLAALIVAFGAGYGVGRKGGPLGSTPGQVAGAVAEPGNEPSSETRKKRPPGLWQEAKTVEATPEERRRITELETIGYLSGYERASDRESVTLWDPELAHDGVNLHSSGHLPEAQLMDMDGTVMHRWHLDFKDAFPNHPADRVVFGMAYWRRLHPFPNGDLLAIYEGYGLIKVDKDSNLIWANAGRYHHDLFVDPNGRIYTLMRRAELIPRIHEEEYVLLDYVTILEADGTVVRHIPLLEAFEHSVYAPLLDNAPEFGDIFHTNTIEVLDGSQAHRSPVFAAGNILLSIREMNVIAILDPQSETIVWALSGQWIRQHQPTMLDSGRMLLFDNLGHHGVSKVIELDPFTQEIVWAYEGTPENGFSSPSGGSNQRLDNGNTLITESEAGRAFEVTPGGRIVWEFNNLARAGENDELIANLCEVIRLDRSFVAPWLSPGDRAARPAGGQP